MPLQGRRVVVTGGTGALGRAVVGRLLAQGAVCHIPVFDPAELQGFPHTGHAGLHLQEGVDLTDETSVEGFYGALPDLWGSVHLAGGFDMAPIGEAGRAHFAKMFDMNALTCFLCCREAVKAIRRTPGSPDGPRGGRIVNVAARPALEPRTGGGMVAYTGSKAAVAAMTQAMAQELAGENIAVNAIAPSIIDTPANRSAMPKADHAAWPKPEELAEAILALVSSESSVTRGAIVAVYGRA